MNGTRRSLFGIWLCSSLWNPLRRCSLILGGEKREDGGRWLDLQDLLVSSSLVECVGSSSQVQHRPPVPRCPLRVPRPIFTIVGLSFTKRHWATLSLVLSLKKIQFARQFSNEWIVISWAVYIICIFIKLSKVNLDEANWRALQGLSIGVLFINSTLTTWAQIAFNQKKH